MRTRLRVVILTFALVYGASACGGEEKAEDRLTVTLYGPENLGLPQTAIPTAALRVSVVDRNTGLRVSQSLLAIDEPHAAETAPDIPFGDNLQLFIEALGPISQQLASGGTPAFAMLEDHDPTSFLVFLSPVGAVSKLSAVFSQDGVELVQPSPFEGGPRCGHTATVVDDGRVLLIGGAELTAPGTGLGQSGYAAIHSSMEVFNPATGYFDRVRDENGEPLSLQTPRAYHTTERTYDGRLLVIGGLTVSGDVLAAAGDAELYEVVGPSALRLVATMSLNEPRYRHASVVRGNGSVVVVGGERLRNDGSTEYVGGSEILMPDNTSFIPAAELPHPRSYLSATAIGELVLVTGGRDAAALGDADLLVENTSGSYAFVSLPPMKTPRYAHGDLRLSSGGGRYIMVAGGLTQPEDAPTESVEILDTEQGQWLDVTVSLTTARGYLELVELADGTILAAGGMGRHAPEDPMSSLTTVDILTPRVGGDVEYVTTALPEGLDVGRYDYAVAQLQNGMVLIAGGARREGGGYASYQYSDVYNPGPPPAVSAP